MQCTLLMCVCVCVCARARARARARAACTLATPRVASAALQKDRGTGRLVAIKKLFASKPSSLGTNLGGIRELAALRMLRHPNILQVRVLFGAPRARLLRQEVKHMAHASCLALSSRSLWTRLTSRAACIWCSSLPCAT
ncbi:hypothetical protein EON66_04430 [archaeon]|nr:MAG: hypothetical protein EON66_04430 [archaeon]